MKKFKIGKFFLYLFLIVLSLLSVLPFLIMFVNATRSTPEIQQQALSFIPSTYLVNNWRHLMVGAFNPFVGFQNSFIISAGATILAVYFSSLTAYGIVAYDWKFKNAFFSLIMTILMIPGTIAIIGFFQFMWQIGLNNSFIPLIVPAIASPGVVFFMRQYLQATLSLEMVEAARIDGSGEFATFNKIVLPIMKPALATQAIFIMVGTWNQLFLPLVLLSRQQLWTMPIMVAQLQGNIYRTEFGAVWLGLALTVLPLFVVYALLSKYIIAGVALGGVKE
ncbi:MAG: carbohydrate ABC transporter permease [Defluviitaleaceae bacterium]|nr:carbohydrate ABC transporter permease [Defluviitaleaceae bacterium]